LSLGGGIVAAALILAAAPHLRALLALSPRQSPILTAIAYAALPEESVKFAALVLAWRLARFPLPQGWLAAATGIRFREAWDAAHPAAAEPKIGLCRFIVLAESDETALALAKRGYESWFVNFNFLFKLKNATPAFGERPGFDAALADGRLVAGRPETVVRALREQLSATPYNYMMGQFAFGNLTPAETQASVGLFIEHVMPALHVASPA